MNNSQKKNLFNHNTQEISKLSSDFGESVQSFLSNIESKDGAYIRLEYINSNKVAYETVTGNEKSLKQVGNSSGLEVTHTEISKKEKPKRKNAKRYEREDT